MARGVLAKATPEERTRLSDVAADQTLKDLASFEEPRQKAAAVRLRSPQTTNVAVSRANTSVAAAVVTTAR